MERKKLFLYALISAIVAVVAYHFIVSSKALVEIQLETDNRTLFRIYYKKTGEPWTQKKVATVPIQPGRTDYSFRLANLGSIDELRVDPSEKPAVVKIKRLKISQEGYAPLRFITDREFARLIPLAGIESAVIDKGLTVTPATKDPQLHFVLSESPGFSFGKVNWVTPLVIFFLAGAAVILLQPLFVDYKFAVVFGFGALFLIAVMAVVSVPNTHPDEHVHLTAGKYYMDHWVPPVVGDDSIARTYSTYGVSRLHSGEIAYFIAGKFASVFSPIHIPSYIILRLFNVALFGCLVFLAIRSYPMRIIMVPMLLSPQIWYVFSYFNSDAFAVFVMMLAAYQCVEPGSWLNKLLDPEEEDLPVLRTVVLGLLFGLILLTKINFYFFIIFIGAYLLWRLLFREFGWTRTTLLRLVAVGVAGAALFGAVRGIDQAVNDFDKAEKVLAAREKYADPMFKPSTPLDKKFVFLQMKDRGVSLKKVLVHGRWGEKIFRSSFGEYGYMTVPASLNHYDLVRYSGLLLLIVTLSAIFIRGGLSGSVLAVAALGCAGAMMAAALYHAWAVDFQAQGRYLLPIVGMVSILLYETRKSVGNLVCTLAFAWFAGLSFYSYIFIALAGIDKVALPFG